MQASPSSRWQDSRSLVSPGDFGIRRMTGAWFTKACRLTSSKGQTVRKGGAQSQGPRCLCSVEAWLPKGCRGFWSFSRVRRPVAGDDGEASYQLLSFFPRLAGRRCFASRCGEDSNFVVSSWLGGMSAGATATREIGTMKSLALKVQRFLKSEDGPTAVEYAVMLALIVVVCLTTITTIGTRANTTFNSIANSLPAGGS